MGLTRRPPLLLGVAAAALGVALTTALLYALRDVAPVVSLGVVYLVVVLAVASVWGVWLGLATALASALAFNFFHIPPTGRLAISGGENWVALIVFFLAAALASSLTELARRRTVEAEQRRQEADLNAEMARLLLRGGRLEETLPAVGERLARAFDAPQCVDRRPGRGRHVPAARGSAPDRDADRGRARSRCCGGSRRGSSRPWKRCWRRRWSATR